VKKTNVTVDQRTQVTNGVDVTSTYFVLIGYSRRELGRPVMNTFTWHELN